MADFVPPPPSPVTQLQAGFPTLQPNSSGTATGTATETPYGATKKNPLGIELGDLAEREDANKQLAGATAEQGENAINRAVMGTELADKKITAGAGDLDELHKFHDEWTKDFHARKERSMKMEDEIAKASQFHDHFTDKNIGDKIIAVIASAALGFGTGHPQNVVADIEAMDHAKQEKQLAALMDRAKMMGASDEQLMKTYEQAESHMKLARAMRFEAIATEFEKQAAQATTVEAQTALKMSAAQNRKLANEERLKYDQSLRLRSSKSATSAVKPPAAAKQD